MTTETHDIALTVNGAEVTGAVEPRLSLADFLRKRLNLVGTHLGCEQGASEGFIRINAIRLMAIGPRYQHNDTFQTPSSGTAPVCQGHTNYSGMDGSRWSSSSNRILRVVSTSDARVTIEGVRAGTATISFRCEDLSATSQTITVVP